METELVGLKGWVVLISKNCGTLEASLQASVFPTTLFLTTSRDNPPISCERVRVDEGRIDFPL